MAPTPSHVVDLDRNLHVAHGSVDGSFSVSWTHRLRFTRDVLAPDNPVLETLLPMEDQPTRTLVVLDGGLLESTPRLVADLEGWADHHRDRVTLVGSPLVLVGGEGTKNDWSAYEATCQAIRDGGICRRSLVLIFGGGAVLDAAGFAAATAHRGVRVIRFPSTTLSQGDAGVGVKNAINAFGVKNFLGTFSPPMAVVNDTHLLKTLDDAHWRGGLSEAVKVAALKDPSLLDQVERDTSLLRSRDLDAMERTLIQSAQLHMNHIVSGGDPFETLHARPLDLGHWSAHRIEALSGWSIPHGDAVALGLAIDLTYSSDLGRLDQSIADRIIRCLKGLGFPLQSPVLDDADALLQGVEEFREHLGGQLSIPLIADLGVADQVHEIDTDLMRASIESVRRGRL